MIDGRGVNEGGSSIIFCHIFLCFKYLKILIRSKSFAVLSWTKSVKELSRFEKGEQLEIVSS